MTKECKKMVSKIQKMEEIDNFIESYNSYLEIYDLKQEYLSREYVNKHYNFHIKN